MKRILIIYCLLCVVACGPTECVALDRDWSIHRIEDRKKLIPSARMLQADSIQLQKHSGTDVYHIVDSKVGDKLLNGKYYSRSTKDSVYYTITSKLVAMNDIMRKR